METNDWWQYQDREFRLGNIPRDLDQAAHGRDVACNLSNCFDSVRHKSRKFEISERFRDELIRLAVGAEMAAHDVFPKHFEREIHAGMQALAATFSIWALTPEDRLLLDLDYYTDTEDRRRILQNIAHKVALREQIEDRAHARRAEEIEALIVRSVRKQGGAS